MADVSLNGEAFINQWEPCKVKLKRPVRTQGTSAKFFKQTIFMSLLFPVRMLNSLNKSHLGLYSI